MSNKSDDECTNVIKQNSSTEDHYIDFDHSTPLHIELNILRLQAEEVLIDLKLLDNIHVDRADYVIRKLLEIVNYLSNAKPN